MAAAPPFLSAPTVAALRFSNTGATAASSSAAAANGCGSGGHFSNECIHSYTAIGSPLYLIRKGKMGVEILRKKMSEFSSIDLQLVRSNTRA